MALRTIFVALSKASWAQKAITRWRFTWKAASRFVAGETGEQALRVVRELNQKGIDATLDHLGEHVTIPEDTRLDTQELIRMIDAIQAGGLRSGISLKLSQLGLVLDEDLCKENLRQILTRAKACDNFVRIDMEDSSLTGQTLAVYRWALEQGFDNTGIVLQSYLYRSQADIDAVAAVAAAVAAAPRIRLCKGAYKEPASVAYPQKKDVDANFDRLAESLLKLARDHGFPPVSADGRVPPIPAFATHDPQRIRFAREAAARLGVPPQAYEFQMLYGIRRDLQDQLAQQGYRVRVYVPYGTHWYPYFMRRLAERPANVWFFISNFLRK